MCTSPVYTGCEHLLKNKDFEKLTFFTEIEHSFLIMILLIIV
jgi:hypothetical protein